MVELFPFGRKKFASELLPLLERARQRGRRQPLVVCSLRDILVGRPDDPGYDQRAVRLANAFFDAVLVHADPRLARLEDTFTSAAELRVPVVYTGFVLGAPVRNAAMRPQRKIIVSAGGGMVGEPLFRAAVEAQPQLWRSERVGMHIVAGPFLPEPAWRSLREAGSHLPALRLSRFVPNLRNELRGAAGSVSQFGYNTALDVLWSGVPALAVPYATQTEDEQTRRATRLEGLGLVRVLQAARLDGPTLASEMARLLHFRPAPLSVDLDGAGNTARLIEELLRKRHAA
jgi:predicted glycosyltransferase